MKEQYLSLRKIAKKYDVHPDTIKKLPLTVGVHFIKIGKMKRYHEENMHQYFTGETPESTYDLDRFLID